MKLIYGLVVGAALCLMAAPLQAQGILLVQKETKGGKTTTNQIRIDRNFMRSESTGEQSAVTFDGAKQTMRILDIGKKTYQEIAKADVDKLKKQMDGGMAEMQAQMAALPAAQRQAMEQMMQGGRGIPGISGMSTAAAPKPEYRAAGADRVGQWACTKYEGYVNQQKTVEVCAANPQVLNVAPADFEMARQMAEFMKSIIPENADRMIVNGSVQEQGYAGIALRRTTFKNGAADTVSEITEFRRETFPASTFDVPAGFKKEAFPTR